MELLEIIKALEKRTKGMKVIETIWNKEILLSEVIEYMEKNGCWKGERHDTYVFNCVGIYGIVDDVHLSNRPIFEFLKSKRREFDDQ